MPSSWGARHGLPGFDRFRTGLTFSDVQKMLYVESDDPKHWRCKRRGTVLGLWHDLKLALYEEATRRGYETSEK